MKIFAYRDLSKIQKGNRFVKWGNFGVDNVDEKLACVRLAEDVFQVGGVRKFTLSKRDNFFTIGSCFARALEDIFISSKLNVSSYTDDFLKWRTINEHVMALGATNRYNTGAIANDFRWHLDEGITFPEDAFLKISDDLYTDPHMNPTLAPGSLEELKERRRVWASVFERLSNVNVVIITLGLIEAWYDEKTELILNSAPDQRAIRKEPKRFSFVKLGFQDNLDNLNEVYHLLSKVCPKNFRMVVTVSPVPMARTFTCQDIVVANQYSKNCLRAVAQEFSDMHENVAYFPSYEIALNSNPDRVWEPSDRRHVKGDFSVEIVQQFFAMYFDDVKFSHGFKHNIKQLLKRALRYE